MNPSMMIESSAALGALGLLLLYTMYALSGKRQHQRMPPGPSGWPIIGNVFDIPRGDAPWVEFRKMAEKFKSDIIYLNAFGTSILVLNSRETIDDLLDKRSRIYSSRPRSVMARELIGWDTLAIVPYGGFWRSQRRLFHSEFVSRGTSWLYPQQIRGVVHLLNRLLESPDQWQQHLRHQAGMTILEAAYGIRAQPKNDPYIETAEATVALTSDILAPGRYLVEILPLLKWVPAWFPGGSFQTVAQEAKRMIKESFFVPFEEVKKAVADGTAAPSFTSRCLQQIDTDGDIASQEYAINMTVSTMFGAGADTIVSALSTFFLAMVKYPEVQAKAQQELDSTIGYGHLPSFGDEESLPYLTAIVKECLRWELVVPFAIPHLSTADDEYRGYHIPAGTMVIPNTWAVMTDESVYPNPTEFNPGRFLTKEGKIDPSIPDPEAAFGYGRRICPGRHMARDSMWLTAGSVLACFDIQKPVDASGKVIEPSEAYVLGLLRQPSPFSCKIKPRSQEAEKAIENLLNHPA